MRKAFTLIELLVVIAIIAILAAILFPVFAQAKQAAKGTASLSNAKQITLAAIMYSGDADDVLMPSAVWNSGSDPIQFSDGTTCGPWSWLVLPYMKSTNLLDDPLGTPTPKLGTNISESTSRAFFPQYGYNYSWLSPNVDDGVGGVKETPIGATTPNAPAETVFLVSKFGRADSQTTASPFWSFGNAAALWTTVEAPDCANNPTYCAANWGKNDGFINDTAFMGVTTVAAGANTGGNAIRANEAAVTAFLDGHAKAMKAGALAAGTNWTKDIDSAATVTTDESKYIWDIR
jgi:prepilin-type N-terminal cleavage/methylation domain-containing protein